MQFLNKVIIIEADCASVLSSRINKYLISTEMEFVVDIKYSIDEKYSALIHYKVKNEEE
jgi:hypothetical protein